MSPVQRRACLALVGLSYGRCRFASSFARNMQRRAERADWAAVELTPRQLRRLAKQHQRYRRQIRSPHLLFWAQRTLADLSKLQEEPCPR